MSSASATSTGYGPPTSGRWQNLQFHGDERRYEQWEVKFMGYMRLKKLKSTIDPSSTTQLADHDDKNEEAFAELIQFLDDRSLSLVMRDAKDKGREALSILREHYRGKGKQRIICLYTELTSLVKKSTESVTDYVLRAENSSTALQEAGEAVSDGLLVAMALKGLPQQYKSFVAVVTQSDKTWSFKDLKTSLRDYEDTERARALDKGSSNNVLKTKFSGSGAGRDQTVSKIVCFTCGVQGHKSPKCPNKPKSGKWCKTCKTSSHNENTCRKRGFQNINNNNNDNLKQVSSDDVNDFHSFHFKVGEGSSENQSKIYSLLVDSGCTSHIVVDDSSFVDFDEDFVPEKHFIELADGRKYNNIALKRGSVKISLTDTMGKSYDSILDNCLYIPSYPENIFSIKAATLKGSSINFYPNYAELVTGDGTAFEIQCRGKLYYLSDVTFVNRVCDLEKWHKILGHCNTNDILKLEPIVDGMKISKKNDFECEPCILGKQTQFISKKSASRAKHPLEFVSSDVCGPIEPVSSDGFRYVVSFVDNYSGFVFVYFCKLKSDVTYCLQKFLADVSPVGKVKCLLDISGADVKRLRSDGGGEYMGNEFKQVLVKNCIKHEQSAPYSPHQNGVAERSWRTLFEMGRCLLIGSGLPLVLWPYAVMASAYIRNRCFQQRVSQTAYFLLTGRKPDMSNMQVFGSVCYSLEQKRSKLDPRSKRGIFVGYDKESPAFLVYYPDLKRVKRCRSVKFTNSLQNNVDPKDNQNNNTNNNPNNNPNNLINNYDAVDDDFPGSPYASKARENVLLTDNVPLEPADVLVTDEVPVEEILAEDVLVTDEVPVEEILAEDVLVREDVVPVEEFAEMEDHENDATASGSEVSRYPRRNHIVPKHLADYDLSTDDAVDVCKMVNIHVPKSYTEAMSCPDSKNWKDAMDDEMESLQDNNTFDVVSLPKGKKIVGGRWVYAIKEGPDEEELFKARYVAKGFTQVHGTDYFETFSPTAKMSSIRILMQVAAEFNLIVHQMDVKTAYLNAPIDVEIYVKQPEGYEIKNGAEVFVLKLNKSLYGLKQSGRNWNSLLHKFFVSNDFVQSSVDPCVYFDRSASGLVIILVWVDDLVLAASSHKLLSKIKNLLKSTFKMKDLGPISCFLGMKFVQHADCIEVDQSRYLKKILARFGMEDCRPRSTPCEVNPAAFDPDESDEPQKKYREIVGSLIYAMVCSRPDLCWVVTKLSQHLDKPNKGDWIMVKHVLRYLKGTLDYKLVYRKSEGGLSLHGYSDSDWAGSTTDRRSTTGYYFSLNRDGPPISWKSRKQPTVALSSCEAEYMALAACSQEGLFLEMLMRDFIPDVSFKPVVIKGDNQGSIALVKNNIVQNRSKHIDIKYHFIRSNYVNGLIDIMYTPTESNVADVMTKPMTKQKLDRFKSQLFGV